MSLGVRQVRAGVFSGAHLAFLITMDPRVTIDRHGPIHLGEGQAELTRGSFKTIPASEENTNTQRFEADSLAEGPGFEPEITESDGVFGRSACPSWGGRGLRFRLMVDVVCVEQPQASWEERSMKHYDGSDVSVKETSIGIVDEAGRICREMKVVSHPEDLLAVLCDPAWRLERVDASRLIPTRAR